MPIPDQLLVLGLVGLLSFGLSYLGASVGLVFGQLRLPVLVVWLGSPVVGAATSMAISAAAALVGAIRHARAGRVDLRLMLTIGIPSAICAGLSTRVAPQLDPALVKLFIGLTLMITGLVMLWSLMRPAPAGPTPAGPTPHGTTEAASSTSPTAEATPRTPSAEASTRAALPPEASASMSMVNARPRPLAEISVGASLGAIAGVVGLLLGTLRLPAMMKIGVHPAKAIGTNMAIGSATGLLAGIATFWDGTVDLWAFGVITPATMVGAYLGASTTGKLDKTTLRRLIAWTLVGVGAWMASDPWW